jgi:CRISPR-associated protein Cmr6
MTWYTRLVSGDPGNPPDANDGRLAPGLLFQKWHAYDAGSLQHKESRPEFLRAVRNAVEAARTGPSGKAYETWLGRFEKALQEVARAELVCFEAKTVWRLAVGMAVNPALETGLTLHPLLGFPYLPGSGVKGLAHHAAEVELLSDQDEWVEGESFPAMPDADTLLRLLDRAELVKVLFGSLHLVPREPDARPRTACSLLAAWMKREEFPRDLLRRAKTLLESTGGMLTFYDAVPAHEKNKDLLQIDVMTPHYPKYYKNQGHPPSDDQDPNPLLFLAVRPGARFRFAFRLGPLPRPEPCDDDQEEERAHVLGGAPREELAAKVKGWLLRGLEVYGAGAKTAAGYGYFQTTQR